jgi:hypothetical protein
MKSAADLSLQELFDKLTLLKFSKGYFNRVAVFFSPFLQSTRLSDLALRSSLNAVFRVKRDHFLRLWLTASTFYRAGVDTRA